MDDARLLERARRGDEGAFTELFGRHQRAIYHYAARMCGSDAADDVVQETFLAVLRQTGRYDASRASGIAYLFGIARHFVLRRLASSYSTECNEELDDDVGSAKPCERETPLEILTREETIVAVRAAVQSLPPVYREVVVLCELEEMDYATAALVIQRPIGTVRSRLHRARALLMTKLAAVRSVRL